MIVYKLKYVNREEGIDDLISKSVYVQTDEGLLLGNKILGVAEIGKITLVDPVFEGENLLNEAIYAEGYHFDVASEMEINFGEKEVFPDTPRHVFAGHETSQNN